MVEDGQAASVGDTGWPVVSGQNMKRVEITAAVAYSKAYEAIKTDTPLIL